MGSDSDSALQGAQAEKEYKDAGNSKAEGLLPASLSDKPHKSKSSFICPNYISVG